MRFWTPFIHQVLVRLTVWHCLMISQLPRFLLFPAAEFFCWFGKPYLTLSKTDAVKGHGNLTRGGGARACSRRSARAPWCAR